jgi:hypothetical protein
MMLQVMMNPVPYQKRKWMKQKQCKPNSHLPFAVNLNPLGMVWQVVPPLKGTKTWQVLLKL